MFSASNMLYGFWRFLGVETSLNQSYNLAAISTSERTLFLCNTLLSCFWHYPARFPPHWSRCVSFFTQHKALIIVLGLDRYVTHHPDTSVSSAGKIYFNPQSRQFYMYILATNCTRQTMLVSSFEESEDTKAFVRRKTQSIWPDLISDHVLYCLYIYWQCVAR